MKRALQVTLGILTSIGGFVDAGAIATAAAAGAVFGLGLVWAMLLGTLAIILMVEMSGRLSAVSGKPYAASIRERFGFKYYLAPLATELIANGLLLAADLGGMAIGLSLLTGVRWVPLVPVAALIVWLMVWRAPFGLIENGPSLVGLVTLSFLVGIVALGGPPGDLWQTLWRPSIERGEWAEYLFLAAAILGAVISPYLLFFYSSGAREEQWSRRDLSLNRFTAGLGMGFGSITSIALIILSAMVLQPRDISGITLSEVGLGMAEAFGPLGARHRPAPARALRIGIHGPGVAGLAVPLSGPDERPGVSEGQGQRAVDEYRVHRRRRHAAAADSFRWIERLPNNGSARLSSRGTVHRCAQMQLPG